MAQPALPDWRLIVRLLSLYHAKSVKTSDAFAVNVGTISYRLNVIAEKHANRKLSNSFTLDIP